MLRKDTMLYDIEKLAQVLATILGLKQHGKVEEAHELINETLLNDFELDLQNLNTISVHDFALLLKKNNYNDKKLDLLGQLIFESAHPFREEDPAIINKLHLVLLIFNLLETEHHIQSFENLAKREMVDNFLNNNQYE